MSDDGRAWVLRHSPYAGQTFLIHYLIGDLVNDMHDNMFFMSQVQMAAKARTTTKTVRAALDQMTTDGYLCETDPRPGAPGRAIRQFVFLKPDVPVVWGGSPNREPRPIQEPPNREQLPIQIGSQDLLNREPGPIEPKRTKEGTKETRAQGSLLSPDDRSHPDYGFGRFWDNYPRRDGKRGHRGKALHLWRTMPYDHKAEAWRQLQEYIRICASGRPSKDAERWLREGIENKWDPAEGWAAGPRGNAPAPTKPVHQMTEEEFLAYYRTLTTDEDRLTADHQRKAARAS